MWYSYNLYVTCSSVGGIFEYIQILKNFFKNIFIDKSIQYILGPQTYLDIDLLKF